MTRRGNHEQASGVEDASSSLHIWSQNWFGDRRVLTDQELTSAGVHCDADSRQLLEDAGAVTRIGNEYELSKAARQILSTFTVAQGPEDRIDIRVDYPEVFVVMPFSQPWSDEVFSKLLSRESRMQALRYPAVILSFGW